MPSYDWNFDRIEPYLGAFQSGLYITILLSIATIVFSTVLGVFWGIGLARSKMLRQLTTLPLDILRSLPPLVLVLFGYYFYVQDVIGFSMSAFWAFVFSVGFNIAAFIADLTRSAIWNAPTEATEVATAMGLSEKQILRWVKGPSALREMIAPLSYLYIETIKITSLASVISVKETVYVAQSIITQTSRSLEVWVIVALVYLVLILPATYFVRVLEVRVKRSAGVIRNA